MPAAPAPAPDLRLSWNLVGGNRRDPAPCMGAPRGAVVDPRRVLVLAGRRGVAVAAAVLRQDDAGCGQQCRRPVPRRLLDRRRRRLDPVRAPDARRGQRPLCPAGGTRNDGLLVRPRARQPGRGAGADGADRRRRFPVAARRVAHLWRSPGARGQRRLFRRAALRDHPEPQRGGVARADHRRQQCRQCAVHGRRGSRHRRADRGRARYPGAVPDPRRRQRPGDGVDLQAVAARRPADAGPHCCSASPTGSR